jgi:hypothetical protein
MEIAHRIRAKGDALRILIAGDNRSQVQYVAVEPKTCWAGTFVSWGKPSVDGAIIDVEGQKYIVLLTPVTSPFPKTKETK